MDEIVIKALNKWPNVPYCYGWLGLDERGDWYMRDDQTQAQGEFPEHKGSRLNHQKLIDFISRNYQADEKGQWYFQNGPQRVYVELACTPWIWRVHPHAEGFELWTHTGLLGSPQAAFEDEGGLLYVLTDLGLGRVHSLDMWAGVEMIESLGLLVETLSLENLAKRFNFISSPKRQLLKEA